MKPWLVQEGKTPEQVLTALEPTRKSWVTLLKFCLKIGMKPEYFIDYAKDAATDTVIDHVIKD